ncbi:ATPase PAAT isoform X2 [Lampris incognitus]|uniref:ATPase PAAT isoform X2 n=1 Tax=Lampris incognitus TaxID=2546036 RepID=UPI0024B4E35D|nr:ATPase PAAT isoform X2 [Lampris incognitus]
MADSESAVTNGPAVGCGSTWACSDQELSGVVIVHINDRDLSQVEGESTNGCAPVLLEQKEGSPCTMTLHCGPQPPSLISSLTVISEARTIEVYSQKGEYYGTCRGERDDNIQPDSVDRGPFYRKHLVLDSPSLSCEVKLLSLGGRCSVVVSRIIVGLQLQEPQPTGCSPSPGLDPGIDMQKVQTLVEEMGTSLSPAAQNLMDMVHFQQKNQTCALGGFLPLLVGSGAFSALVRGANRPQETVMNGPQAAASMYGLNATINRPPSLPYTNGSTEPFPSVQNGSMLSDSESDSTSSSSGLSLPAYSESPSPVNHAQLAEMMSHFLNGQTPGQGFGQALSSTPNFLPMLQTVCGQVTQLRLDDAAVTEKKRETTTGTWELDQAMERRLEEMEQRLKEHIDSRLDALEQKLERALVAALPLSSLNQGSKAMTGEPAFVGSSEQINATQT